MTNRKALFSFRIFFFPKFGCIYIDVQGVKDTHPLTLRVYFRVQFLTYVMSMECISKFR